MPRGRAWLYSPYFYLGVSSAQLLGNQLDVAYSPSSQAVHSNKLKRHYFATAGVRVPLSDDLSLVLSVLIKYRALAPVSVDINS